MPWSNATDNQTRPLLSIRALYVSIGHRSHWVKRRWLVIALGNLLTSGTCGSSHDVCSINRDWSDTANAWHHFAALVHSPAQGTTRPIGVLVVSAGILRLLPYRSKYSPPSCLG